MAATTMRMIWGPGVIMCTGAIGNMNTFALDSNNDYLAWIIGVERAGVVDTVSINVATKNGANRSWSIRIEGVTNGNPSGALFGGSAAETLTPAAAGHHTVTFSTPATVAQGDLIAIVMVPTGTAPDGTNNIVVNMGAPNYSGTATTSFPQARTSTTAGASWGYTDAVPVIGIRYADGDWLSSDFDTPGGLSSLTAFLSGDSPNEYGARFQVPYLMSCFGVRFAHRGGGTLNHPTVHLYDASSVEQRSVTIFERNAQSRTVIALWNPIDLAANTNYFIGLQNSSAVDSIREPWYGQLDDADKRGGYPWADGLRWAYATRTGAGAWSIDTTRVPAMALLINGVG